MKRVLFIAACAVLPGGLALGAGYLAVKWWRRRQAREAVRVEMARLGAPVPRETVRA